MPRPVIINGEHIVSITNGTFVAMPLKPGTYKIEAGAQAFIPDKEKRKAEPDITLKVEKGKTYFIRQFVEGSIIGNVGRSDVMMLQTGAGGPIPIMLGGDGPPPFKAALVDGAQGREGCSKLKLVGSDPVP